MIIQTLKLILLDLSLLLNQFPLFKISLLDPLLLQDVVGSRVVTHAPRIIVILVSHLASANGVILLLKLLYLRVWTSSLIVHAVYTPLLLLLTGIVVNIRILLLHPQ